MGCFNVACSVSGISIGSGDPVVFIPLVPKRHYRTGIPQIEPKTLLLGQDIFYTPFCLPIYGEYNDYGGVENIEMDANAEAVEKFTGMPLEEFIDSLGRGRSYASSCWEASERFFKFPKIMGYSEALDVKFMTTLGFEKKEDGRFHYPGLKHTVELIPSGWDHKKDAFGFTIYDGENKQVYSSAHDDKEAFLDIFAKHSKYLLGVDPKHHEIVKVMLQLSGMFVHKGVWDELVKGHSEADAGPTIPSLEKMGFKFIKNCPKDWESHKAKLYTHPENEKLIIRARESNFSEILKKESDPWGNIIHNWYEFAEVLGSEYGISIDASGYEYQSGYSNWFDKLQRRVNSYNNLTQKTAGKFYYGLSKEEREPLMDSLSDEEAEMFMSMRSPLRDNDGGDMWDLKDWTHLEAIYSESIANGAIKKNMTDWKSAYSTMYSANVFLFPAMNGEQHGDHQVSKRVLEAALSVVNAKIKEHSEDYE